MFVGRVGTCAGRVISRVGVDRNGFGRRGVSAGAYPRYNGPVLRIGNGGNGVLIYRSHRYKCHGGITQIAGTHYPRYVGGVRLRNRNSNRVFAYGYNCHRGLSTFGRQHGGNANKGTTGRSIRGCLGGRGRIRRPMGGTLFRTLGGLGLNRWTWLNQWKLRQHVLYLLRSFFSQISKVYMYCGHGMSVTLGISSNGPIERKVSR